MYNKKRIVFAPLLEPFIWWEFCCLHYDEQSSYFVGSQGGIVVPVAGNMPPRSLEDYELAGWVCLVKDVVSVLGIVGNIILIAVRMQSHLRNTFNKLLVTLAIFDSLALVLGLMYSTMRSDKGTFLYDTLTVFFHYLFHSKERNSIFKLLACKSISSHLC